MTLGSKQMTTILPAWVHIQVASTHTVCFYLHFPHAPILIALSQASRSHFCQPPRLIAILKSE